jgi:hypothetical protein
MCIVLLQFICFRKICSVRMTCFIVLLLHTLSFLACCLRLRDIQGVLTHLQTTAVADNEASTCGTFRSRRLPPSSPHGAPRTRRKPPPKLQQSHFTLFRELDTVSGMTSTLIEISNFIDGSAIYFILVASARGSEREESRSRQTVFFFCF